jgi:very-short-patch-repair endonuclease
VKSKGTIALNQLLKNVMNNIALIVIATFALLLVASLLPKKQSKLKPLSQLKLSARRPLTAREQQMFFRLTETLTDCTVFAQMPLAALLTSADRQDRNRFDRKIADFLICTKTLTPIAVIELDDASHNNKAARDADRDAMLKNAGYQTIRYRDFPTSTQIRQDIETAFKTTSGLASSAAPQ